MLKKSQVLKEGYNQGLRDALKVIRKKLLRENAGASEIQEFCEKINNIYQDAFDTAIDGDDYDYEYLEEHAPCLTIETSSPGFSEYLGIIEGLHYDPEADKLFITIHPNDGTITVPNFSEAFENRKVLPYGGGRFICTAYDRDDEPFKEGAKVKLDIALV